MTDKKILIFLCSSATKATDKKLSKRIALELEKMNVYEIGKLGMLNEQHRCAPDDRAKMIFINDCKSGCVKVLASGFSTDDFLYIDVSPFLNDENFDVSAFIKSQILPQVSDKWNYEIVRGHNP